MRILSRIPVLCAPWMTWVTGETEITAAAEAPDQADGETVPAGVFINIGKNQNVKPGDILGAIAGESGMPGKMVGSIDMYDKYTFVEVPREQADIVLQAMKDARIKGKNIHIEKANRR